MNSCAKLIKLFSFDKKSKQNFFFKKLPWSVKDFRTKTLQNKNMLTLGISLEFGKKIFLATCCKSLRIYAIQGRCRAFHIHIYIFLHCQHSRGLSW